MTGGSTGSTSTIGRSTASTRSPGSTSSVRRRDVRARWPSPPRRDDCSSRWRAGWGSSTGHRRVWRDWIALEPEGFGNRLNDGRCDPAGRFWVGSMFDPASARNATGMLHRIEPDGTAVTVRSGIGVANGLAFAPDGRTMYFADTPRRRSGRTTTTSIRARPATSGSSSISSRCPAARTGQRVDEAGCYWIACRHGRHGPPGDAGRGHRSAGPHARRRSRRWSRSAARGCSTLYITTIGGGGSHAVDPSQPDAGGLFAVEPGVSGLVEPRFGGGTGVGAM